LHKIGKSLVNVAQLYNTDWLIQMQKKNLLQTWVIAGLLILLDR